ncbi:MAG: hypothetical protein Q8M94_12830 [Ignavibacteria bacterium]|nr:hypothetical protein [Ignavibacteria bacterium]
MTEEQKITIIGLENCAPCEELKAKLGDTVDYIDLNSEEGKEILRKGEIPLDENEKVKIPLAIDEKGQFCEIFFDDNLVIAVCGDEQRVLYEKEDLEDDTESEQ